MAEPTDAERTRVWDLVESQIAEEMAKTDVDWQKVRDLTRELADHVESFTSRPDA